MLSSNQCLVRQKDVGLPVSMPVTQCGQALREIPNAYLVIQSGKPGFVLFSLLTSNQCLKPKNICLPVIQFGKALKEILNAYLIIQSG